MALCECAVLSDERGHPYRHQDAWDVYAQPCHVPSWRVAGEPLGVLLVQASEVRRVGQQHAYLDHVVQGGTTRSEDRPAVLQCLPGLLLNRRARERVRARVDADEARDEDVAPARMPWL